MARMQRLAGPRPDEFSTPIVDERKPVRFSLDGRVLRCWAGDSVLSAALANGIDTVGLRDGHPVGLTESFAPPVVHRGNLGRPDLALPMALCPAVDGLDLVTLAPRRRRSGLGSLFKRRSSSLELDLDAPMLDFAPWIDSEPTAVRSVDCVIVGGGLAGMAAARAAGRAGLTTVLIEDKQVLGGLSRYFGRAEGEPDPAEAVATMAAELAALTTVTVETATLALRVSDGAVETVGVSIDGTIAHPRRTRFLAPSVVLATGVAELLPVFPGNRLPGVTLSSAAWSLAHRFSLWPGATTLVHGVANVAYRMALLGSASGIKVLEASDPRIAPESRFIEFCKAYGFKLRWGIAVDSMLAANGKLGVYSRDLQADRGADLPEMVDTAIVSGGFHPDLSLWVAAGGRVTADAAGTMRATGAPPPGLALAGYAAGVESHSGTMASGEAAIATLNGTVAPAITDRRIDPAFETPQLLYPVPGPGKPDDPPAYFGSGRSLSAFSRAATAVRKRGLFRRRDAEPAQLDREPFALELDDCLGKFAAGGLSPDQLDQLIGQRCVPPFRLGFAPAPSEGLPPTDPRVLPDFLDRRFGATAHVWQLAPADGRRLSPGALLYLSSDRLRPDAAIGVVLGEVAGIGPVGMFGANRRPGETLVVRDGPTPVAVSLVVRAERSA